MGTVSEESLTFDGSQIPKNPEMWLIHLDNVQLKVFQKEAASF